MSFFGKGKKAKETSQAATPAATPTSKRAFNDSAVQEIFDRFADVHEPTLIKMDGIINLCSEIGMDAASDVRVLVMLFKLGAVSTPGAISSTEFTNGMRSLGFDSLAKLRERGIPTYDPGFIEEDNFREFYRFCFQYNRENKTIKSIEKEVVVALLPIAICGRSPYIIQFTEFLAANPITRINLDQWESFYAFSRSITPDLRNYDENGAWPILIDEFVRAALRPHVPTVAGRK